MADEKHMTDYLANERTFLAWIRTCIAIISLGFVVAKFGVWLRELAARLDPQTPMHGTGASLAIGIAMMALGGVLAVLSARHFNFVNAAIARGEAPFGGSLITTVTVSVALLAMAMIVYMLATAHQF